MAWEVRLKFMQWRREYFDRDVEDVQKAMEMVANEGAEISAAEQRHQMMRSGLAKNNHQGLHHKRFGLPLTA